MKTYKSALITGASSGLGEEFARQLAPISSELILVARRADKLEELKQSLHQQHPDLNIICEPTDLNNEAQISTLIAKLDSLDYCPDLLVNNAGMGDLGSFKNSDWQKLSSMMNLNMSVLTRLSLAVIPAMLSHGKGSIIQVSSLASTLPIPDFAVYAATKSYVSSFTEALRLELKEHNINVTALCPGPIHTEFGKIAERHSSKKEFDMRSWAYVTPQLCISSALKAVRKNKPLVFPGILVKTFATLFRMTPIALLRLPMSRRPRKTD